MRAPLLSLIILSAMGLVESGIRTKNLSVELKDLSPDSSPLHATGQGTFVITEHEDSTEISCALNAQITNVSSQPILAFEAVVELLPSYEQKLQPDFVFSKELLLPGSHFPADIPPFKSRLPYRQHFESVGAEVTVTFVEFADGTTFGRSQWGNQLPLQREKELGYMQKLIESYDQGGKTALAGALSAEAVRETDPTYLKLFALEMQDLLEHSGSDSVMQRLRGSVQYAIARMKSPSRPD